MKKKHICLICLLLMIVSVVAAINYSPGTIPFPYDPNQILGDLLGGVITEANQPMIIPLTVTDAEGHPFAVITINPPIGLYVINDADNWRVQWTPDVLQAGTWYVTLEATDIPPPPYSPKSYRGTIVVEVYLSNTAPVIHPLEDSPVAIHGWPNNYQKKWQELVKQRTIIKGPVVMPLQ